MHVHNQTYCSTDIAVRWISFIYNRLAVILYVDMYIYFPLRYMVVIDKRAIKVTINTTLLQMKDQ